MLTAARANEARLATWPEMDRAAATWTVPAERMKARREHKVPLTGRALELLSLARELSPQDNHLVFPASRSGKALSDMALTVLLRRLEILAVPHGFRSSFKDWCTRQYKAMTGGCSARRPWPTTWGTPPRCRMPGTTCWNCAVR